MNIESPLGLLQYIDTFIHPTFLWLLGDLRLHPILMDTDYGGIDKVDESVSTGDGKATFTKHSLFVTRIANIYKNNAENDAQNVWQDINSKKEYDCPKLG